MCRLLIATSNFGKLREVQFVLRDLPLTFLTLRDFPNVPEAVEDGETFEENAKRKASHYAGHTGCWTLADDSGLEVDALSGAPGVYSARYAGPNAKDADNNSKLISQLATVPASKRTARFRCVIALAKPIEAAPCHDQKAHPSPLAKGGLREARVGDLQAAAEIVAIAHGSFEGVIIDQPRGANGFGYDPHFLVPSLGLTSAELPPEEKNAISHRGQALRAIRPAIDRAMAGA
jgi:XTP/dITP diphosphohydrolase